MLFIILALTYHVSVTLTINIHCALTAKTQEKGRQDRLLPKREGNSRRRSRGASSRIKRKRLNKIPLRRNREKKQQPPSPPLPTGSFRYATSEKKKSRVHTKRETAPRKVVTALCVDECGRIIRGREFPFESRPVMYVRRAAATLLSSLESFFFLFFFVMVSLSNRAPGTQVLPITEMNTACPTQPHFQPRHNRLFLLLL